MKRSLIFASDLFIMMCDLGKRDFISQLFFITKLKMKLLQIVSYTLAIVYSSVAQNPGKMKKNETFFSIFSTLCIRRDESCQNLIFSTFPPLLSLQLFLSRGKTTTFLSTRYLSFPQNVPHRFSWIGPIWPFVKAQRLFSNAQWTCQLHVWRIRPSNGTNWIRWTPSKSCCLRIRA